ncbi:hypothetical protein HWV62_35818 [Athelia sp. TMB]|nr:hypothetical protein HWV62_35818 [Athelia sp. TMB]
MSRTPLTPPPRSRSSLSRASTMADTDLSAQTHTNTALNRTARTPPPPPRASGAKTPRKVQWALADATHALDEHGLDPNAFETLTHALERHRSSATDLPLPAPAPAAVPVPVVAVPEQALRNPHARPAPVNFGSDSSSPFGVAHARDYARSRTPPPINTHSHSHTRTNSDSYSSPGTTAPSSPSTPGSPTDGGEGGHAVPGESYIDADEAAGLPGTADMERFASARARTVVRAHTGKRGWGFAGRRKEKEKTKTKGNGEKGDGEKRGEGDGGDTDVEAPREPMHAPLRMGGGVLAALLTLYNPPPDPDSRNASSTDLSSANTHTPESLKPWLHDPPPAATKKRPGLAGRLSRLSLDSNLPTRASLALKRPASMHFGREGPGSHTPSSGAQTPHTDHTHTEPTHEKERGKEGGGRPGLGRMWTGARTGSFASLKSLAGLGLGGQRSGEGTPTTDGEDGAAGEGKGEKGEKERGDGWAAARRRREEKRRKKKAAAFGRALIEGGGQITRHVAELLQRQEFLLKLARALMMFGGPPHRLAAQLQATARVLGLELAVLYLPDVLLVSFNDGATGTSAVRLIKQGAALDLQKLAAGFRLYWAVIHDEASVGEAGAALDVLMRRRPFYGSWQLVGIGGLCSAAICTVSFAGSFVDALVALPLGALLVGIQLLSVRNELYSNVFEITVATLLSFLAAVFAGTRHFCYSAVASSSVVLILPGYIVTLGALELTSRSIVSGAVRLCFAAVYALFLGFGIAIGVEVYEKLAGRSVVGASDYSCQQSHDPDGPWWQQTPSLYWAFLTVPMYSLFLSMRNQAPYNTRELPITIAISCVGWVTNHFVGTKFINQNDISAAVGAFAVGFISNLYGRFFGGNAFVVMITGVLFQVPSGLSNGGLLQFASQQTAGSSNAYLSGFDTALQLISVAIGLTVGLSISLVVVHPIQSRRRAAGIFSL